MPSQSSVFDEPSGPGYRGRHYVSRGPQGANAQGSNGGRGPQNLQPSPPPAGDEVWTGDEPEDGDLKGPRRSWKQRAILSVLGTVIVLCLVGIAVGAYGIRTWGNIERFDDLALDQVAHGDPTNYLIVGSDAREEHQSNLADSIVLFRVEPQNEQAAVMTIPRDLLVPLAENGEFDPGSEPRQINQVYSGATGRDDLILTLRENFGVPIHHYIEIDFEGFQRLIDHVGGVEIYLDQAVHDPKTGLLIEDLGCVNLDGKTALQFVRSRAIHTPGENGWVLADPTADLGRGTRQQEFIRQAVGKALNEAPTNPNQMRGVIDILSTTVGLDENIRISDVLDLVEQFRGIDAQNEQALQTLSLPIEEIGDRVALRERQAEPILNVFRGLPLDEVSPKMINLTVLNGTGGENEATNVAGAFQNVEVGFNIAEVGDTEERPERTTIYTAPGEENLGLRVARHIDGGAIVQPRDDLGSGDVELVTGPGLEKIFEMPIDVEDLPDTQPGPGGQAPDAGGEGEPAGAPDEADPPAEAESEEPAASEKPDTTTTTVEYGAAVGGGSC